MSYKSDHARRFELSLQWLDSHRPKLDRPLRVLETGGFGAFTPMYRERWPNDVIEETTFDLKDWPISASAGEYLPPVPRGYDLVLSMEVLEHLNDRWKPKVNEQGRVVPTTEWQGDGVRGYLAGMASALLPGGVLFLTTPNACSITAIHHALHQKPPMLYRPHVREYAPYELDHLVREAGFGVRARETLDVWRNAISAEGYAHLHRFIADSGYPRELRGEDIFLVGVKP